MLGAAGFLKYYIDAKVDGVKDALSARMDGMSSRIDSLAADVKMLIGFMMSHETRITALEEKTRKL